MTNLKIERCVVSGMGRGYKIVDADTGNNFWNILYDTTQKAIKDCGEHTVVSVCLSWPEFRDECGNLIKLTDPDYDAAWNEVIGADVHA